MKLYFKDNFFSSGKTEILGEQQEALGEIDLRSAFGSAMDIYDSQSALLYSGKFPMLSNKWQIFDATETEVGRVIYRLAFFSKRFEYEKYGRGSFEITSPAFSREYKVSNESGEMIASFDQVNGWFMADAYCLDNHSDVLDSYELIAVIMGMHQIQKRHRSAANGG
jgi:uncharacterized protein YxjI